MTVVLVHVKRWKKFEGRKSKLSPVHHQTCIVPSRNHESSSELIWFVRGVCPNFRQTCQFFTTSSWWHDITSSKVSCVSDLFFNFVEFKCHGTPCMCPGRETNMFENSFQFTAHGINSRTSTCYLLSLRWFFP